MPKMKILQVEDDEDILEISRMALELIGGLEVHQFVDGNVAISQAEAIQPDVLLLDVMMPKMSGEETLAGLRRVAACAETPAFFMTAKSSANSVESLFKLGVVDVLMKPFDPLTLAEQITGAVAAARR